MRILFIILYVILVLHLLATIINIPADQPTIQEGIIIEDDLITTANFEISDCRAYWNFEDNNGGFTSNDPAGWQWGIPSNGPSNAYSGDKLWGTVLANNYPNGANFTLDSPEYYLITSFNPILFFWHWYDIENGYDGGNVKVSADGGTTWSVITPLAGYTGTANSANPLYPEEIFCGTSPGWEYEEFDLSSYAGQNLIFRWHFGSDSSVTYPGWFIDDVGITGFSFGYLFGTVTEFGSGNPIEGATVSIVGTGLSDTTQADGFYEILGTWPGVFDISCVAPLYLDAEELNFSIATVITTLDFSLLWSEISVYPDEIICHLPPDTVGIVSFTITNNGPGDLEYLITTEYTDAVKIETFTPHNIRVNRKSLSNTKKVCEVKQEFTVNDTYDTSYLTDETWLGMIINISGTVSGNGGTVVVLVTINSADLLAGDIHNANLVIHNNSNYGGDFILPITLIVENVNVEQNLLPLEIKLIGNYPNPFNPVTNISYSIIEAGYVKLEVYNLRGQLVKTLFNEIKETGKHITSWDGTDNSNKPVSSGVYFYKIYSGKFTSTKKMMLMK